MKILIIDDEPTFRDYLALILTDIFKHQVTITSGYQQASQMPLKQLASFDIAFIDMKMPVLDGFQSGLRLKQQVPGIVTIMLTAYPSVEKAIVALRDHQFDDFLVKEDLEDVEEFTQLKNALHRGEKLAAARKALTNEYQLSDLLRSKYSEVYSELIGESAPMKQVKELVIKVAPSDTTVLIGGETGTGKELLAREIHRRSRRRLKPFIPINCAAIPVNLLESELFGHKKGAFTGAVGNREGYFRLAEGGTLFLDEIGDMSLDLQSKLLRVLEDRQFFPVGSGRLNDAVQVDVRIISASHQDLAKKTEAGEFRQDLLYRLNTMVLTLPPLRERVDDIEMLAEFFLAQNPGAETIKGIRVDAIDLLKQWSWPGNVRELKNVIERAALLHEGDFVDGSNLPVEMREQAGYDHRVEPPAARLPVPVKRAERNDASDLGMTSAHSSQSLLWGSFKENNFKLWTFQNASAVTDALTQRLAGARYVKKGHSARLIVADRFDLDVEIRYLNAESGKLEEIMVRFGFQSDDDHAGLSKSAERQTWGGKPLIYQPVAKGQPDTYLFNLLYKPVRRSELGVVSSQQIIRAALLRFALSHAHASTLKSVFGQTMTFMMDDSMADLVEGLNSTGLEAMRAYLCGADHIFSGMARKLKSDSESVRQEICSFFPDYRS